MNQDLKLCAARGHALYLPSDNESLKTQLYANSVSDPSSVSGYRCLRCGNFVPVSALKDTEPKRLPLVEIPLIPRGNHNRKLYSLKLIAMERWIRAAFIFVIALGLFRLTSSSNHLYASLVDLTKAAQPLADKLGFNTSQSHTLHLIENSLTWSSSKYITLGLLLMLYSAVQVLEGYGLWKGARWGEYLASIATALFIPLEIYEVATHSTIIKIGALALNLIILLYLLLKERLFGIRGGHKAHRRELYESTLIAELLKKSKP